MTLNICRLTGGMSNLFLGKVLEAFKKHSNYSLQCPTRKGFYKLTNMSTTGLRFPFDNFHFNFKMRVFVLFKNEKKKKEIGFVDFYGLYSNKWSCNCSVILWLYRKQQILGFLITFQSRHDFWPFSCVMLTKSHVFFLVLCAVGAVGFWILFNLFEIDLILLKILAFETLHNKINGELEPKVC